MAVVALALFAQPRSARGADVAAARDHLRLADTYFAEGRFDLALGEYRAAYTADPLPAFLFDIGQCERNLRAYDAAIFAFKEYLAQAPTAPNREAVLELIADLDAQKHDAEAAAAQAVAERHGTASGPLPGSRPASLPAAAAARPLPVVTTQPDAVIGPVGPPRRPWLPASVPTATEPAPLYERGWFWGAAVAAAAVAGGAALLWTRPAGVPPTPLGNISFPR